MPALGVRPGGGSSVWSEDVGMQVALLVPVVHVIPVALALLLSFALLADVVVLLVAVALVRLLQLL